MRFSSSSGQGSQKQKQSLIKDVLAQSLAELDAANPNTVPMSQTAGLSQNEEITRKIQEKVYEQKFGKKPPSSSTAYRNYVPALPLLNSRRLPGVSLELFDDDPWPARSYHQPYENVHGERIRELTDEESASLAEAFGEASSTDGAASESSSQSALVDLFGDALDEVSFWESRLLEFCRKHYPFAAWAHLPFMDDRFKHLIHRLYRAERRLVTLRNKCMPVLKTSPDDFALTEKRINRLHQIYSETYKSVGDRKRYNPLRIRKSFLGKILKMNEEEFENWKNDVQRAESNEILGKFVEANENEAMGSMQ